MAYKKSLNWYISRELRPVGKRLEKWINKRGTPKVKVVVEKRRLVVLQPFYAKYQDEGVKGVAGGKSLTGRKYTDKAPPPAAFARYTSDPSGQFAISRSIYEKGFKAKKYIGKGVKHFVPQISMAITRGGTKYIKTEIMPAPGVHKVKI